MEEGKSKPHTLPQYRGAKLLLFHAESVTFNSNCLSNERLLTTPAPSFPIVGAPRPWPAGLPESIHRMLGCVPRRRARPRDRNSHFLPLFEPASDKHRPKT